MSPVDAPHTTSLWMSHIGVANLLAWILWFALKTLMCVIGELKNRHQKTMWAANYDRVIGELKFVSRTLAKDRARFDEIANLKNKVQVLERWLEKSWTREEVLREKIGQSWTREEVLREKISQCAASGALVLVHSLNSLNASAFARKSDADELELDLPVLRTRSAPV